MLKLWCPGTLSARVTCWGEVDDTGLVLFSEVVSGPAEQCGERPLNRNWETECPRADVEEGRTQVRYRTCEDTRPSQGRPISVALIKQLVSSVVSNLDLSVSPTTCRESQPNIPLETFIRHAPTDSTSLQLPKPKLGATRVPGVGQTLSSGFLSRRRRPDGTAVAGFTLRETVPPRRSTL